MQDYKKKYCRWVFTSYEQQEPTLHDQMQCLIFQRERCPTTGREHWQGGFQLKNRNGVQLKSAKKLLYGHQFHLEPMMGTWEDTVKYCSKTESQVSSPKIFGAPPAYGNELKAKKTSRLKEMFELVKQGKSKMEIIEADPETYIRNHNGIDKVMELCKPNQVVKRFDFEDFDMEPIDWDELADDNNDPVYSVVFIGPSGTGKTEFALAHFNNPLFVTHKDDLKALPNGSYDGIVFDDMSFKHWPREVQIHIVDGNQPRSIDVKNGKITIPAFTKKIFTCNEPIFSYDPAIERRYKEIKIEKKIQKNVDK